AAVRTGRPAGGAAGQRTHAAATHPGGGEGGRGRGGAQPARRVGPAARCGARLAGPEHRGCGTAGARTPAAAPAIGNAPTRSADRESAQRVEERAVVVGSGPRPPARDGPTN